MGDDDLEALDIVPVDLEPVDAESSRRTPRPDSRPGARPWLWGAVLGAGLIAWAAIALTTRGSHAHSTTPPTSIPTPASRPPTPAITTLEPRLADGLRGVGSGRFAIVVDDRLYLLNVAGADSQATLVPLPEGHVTIDDQSGTSLLASTFLQTLVSTQPAVTRTLAVDEVAIRGTDTNPWILLKSDGTLRDQRGDIIAYEPAGLRVFGALDDGYVADDPAHNRWVFWSPAGTQTIAPGSFQLLTTGPRVLAFKSGCGYGGCELELIDLQGRIIVSNRIASVPQFGAFSPDGSRLALASTQGDVSIVDTSTGGILGAPATTTAQNVSLPFSWTPDSRELIVVGQNDVEILRASDGVMTADIVVPADLEQLIALP